MLKGLVGIIVFIILFIAFIAAVVLYLMYKGIRNIRDVQEQFINNNEKRFSRTEYMRYQNEQRDKNPFGKDYFKSSGSNKKEKTKSQSQAQKETTTRRTVETGSGVTIIDGRADKKADRKIFDDNEGEYVEFTEVAN